MSETDRVAVVVGGASGIGAAVAAGLAAEGCRVIVADRNADGAAALAAELGSPHTSAQVDVTDEDTVAGLFEAGRPGRRRRQHRGVRRLRGHRRSGRRRGSAR